MTHETREQTLRSLDQSAADHAEILARTRAIESMVETNAHPASGDVARKLRALGDFLADHFVEEEAGTLYTALPELFPDMRREISERRQEHATLVVALRQLADEADRASEVSLESELGMRIRAAVAALRQHEVAESNILLRARRMARP